MAIKVIPASEILQTPDVNILNDNVIKDVNYNYNKSTLEYKSLFNTTIKGMNAPETQLTFEFMGEPVVGYDGTSSKYSDASADNTNVTYLAGMRIHEGGLFIQRKVVYAGDFNLPDGYDINGFKCDIEATELIYQFTHTEGDKSYPIMGTNDYVSQNKAIKEITDTEEIYSQELTSGFFLINAYMIKNDNKISFYVTYPIYSYPDTETTRMDAAITKSTFNFKSLCIANENVSVDNNSQVDLQANELIQDGTKINNAQISQYIANNIKQYYKNGKATIGLVCNYKGDNEYKVGDLVIPMKSNTEPILLDEEGNGKIFEVTSNEITYDGFGKQSLELVEFKIKKFNPTSWQYKRLPETQKFKFATGVGNAVYLTKTQMESSSGTDYALYKLNNFETEEGILTWKQITPQEVTTATNNKIEIVGLEHFEQNILIAVKQSYTTDIGNEYQFKIYNYNTTTENLTSFYSNFFSISSDLTIDTSINGVLLQVFRVASNVLFLQYRYQDGNTKSYTYLYFNNLDTTPTRTFNANIRSNRVIYAKDGFVYPLSTNNIINTSIGSLTERNNISCGIRNGTNSPLYIIYSQDLDKYVIGYSTFEQSDANLVKYIEKLAIGDLGTNMQTKSITQVNCNNNYDNNIYMGVFEKKFVLIGSTLKNVYSSKDFDTITETQTTQETTDAQPIWLGEVGDAIVCVGASYDNNGNVIGNSIIISEKEV